MWIRTSVSGLTPTVFLNHFLFYRMGIASTKVPHRNHALVPDYLPLGAASGQGLRGNRTAPVGLVQYTKFTPISLGSS